MTEPQALTGDGPTESELQALVALPDAVLELGLDLVPLVDPDVGGDGIARLDAVRATLATELGWLPPPFAVRDNLAIATYAYRLLLRGACVARGEVFIGYTQATEGPHLDAERAEAEPLIGFPTTDPSTGRAAVWVADAELMRAADMGYFALSPMTVIALHVDEALRRHAHALFTLDDAAAALERLRATRPVTAAALRVDLPTFHQVLRRLLRERVSVRDTLTVTEALVQFAPLVGDAATLAELVRTALARPICEAAASEAEPDVLYVALVDEAIDALIRDALVTYPTGNAVALAPPDRARVDAAFTHALAAMRGMGLAPVFLCSPDVRPFVSTIVDRLEPRAVVLSYNEIPTGFRVMQTTLVCLDESDASAP